MIEGLGEYANWVKPSKAKMMATRVGYRDESKRLEDALEAADRVSDHE